MEKICKAHNSPYILYCANSECGYMICEACMKSHRKHDLYTASMMTDEIKDITGNNIQTLENTKEKCLCSVRKLVELNFRCVQYFETQKRKLMLDFEKVIQDFMARVIHAETRFYDAVSAPLMLEASKVREAIAEITHKLEFVRNTREDLQKAEKELPLIFEIWKLTKANGSQKNESNSVLIVRNKTESLSNQGSDYEGLEINIKETGANVKFASDKMNKREVLLTGEQLEQLEHEIKTLKAENSLLKEDLKKLNDELRNGKKTQKEAHKNFIESLKQAWDNKVNEFTLRLGKEIDNLSENMKEKISSLCDLVESHSLVHNLRIGRYICWIPNTILTLPKHEKDFCYVHFYDIKSAKSIKRAIVPFVNYDYGLVQIYEKIFMIGGWNNNIGKDYNTIYLLNLATDPIELIPKSNMSYSRYRFETCVFRDNFIYAICGDGHSVPLPVGSQLNTVDRYDIENDKWELMPSLNERRGYCAACLLSSTIYVFGGFLYASNSYPYYTYSKTIEKFEIESPGYSKWEYVSVEEPQINFLRKYRPLMVPISCNQILIIGGYKTSDDLTFSHPTADLSIFNTSTKQVSLLTSKLPSCADVFSSMTKMNQRNIYIIPRPWESYGKTSVVVISRIDFSAKEYPYQPIKIKHDQQFFTFFKLIIQ
eukprot:TRINITY_DN470_c1_g2_i4.p1 TRINITY_DN470_c1_g2~~TRINITY_DN470_c1_g2_i4.p1  ORF type:complete len:654 (-),score=31.30 TRINITY_DN470_c1_g2_i4:757-2718(-)